MYDFTFSADSRVIFGVRSNLEPTDIAKLVPADLGLGQTGRLDDLHTEIASKIRLTNEYLGVVMTTIAGLEDLANGKMIKTAFMCTNTIESRFDLGFAIADWYKGDPELANGPLYLPRFRKVVSAKDAPKRDLYWFDGSILKTPLYYDHIETMIVKPSEDFLVAGQNTLALAVLAAEKAGFEIAPEAVAYAKANTLTESPKPTGIAGLLERADQSVSSSPSPSGSGR